MNKWINVKDRLPKFNITVICYTLKNFKPHYTLGHLESVNETTNGNSTTWRGLPESGYNGYFNPTHWMPLPKNPIT